MLRYLAVTAITASLACWSCSPANAAATMWVWLMYGVGGSITSDGVDTTAITLRKNPSLRVFGPYQWTESARIAREMDAAPVNVKLALGMIYSCGASQGPTATALTKRQVAIIAAVQASVWCPGSALTPNVQKVQLTYNPNCWQTFWLGCATYKAGPGFPAGRITYIVRYDMHPYADTDPDAQRDVVSAINAANAAPKLKAARPVAGNVPRVIMRRSTWR